MFRRLGLRLIILPDDWVADIPCRACVCGPAWSSNWKNRTPVRNLIERDVPFCALQQGLVLSKVQITAPQRAQICPVGVYIAILCSPRFCIDAVHFQLSIHQSTLFHGCNSLFEVRPFWCALFWVPVHKKGYFCGYNSHFQSSIHQNTLFHGCNSLFDVNSESQRQKIYQDSSQRVQTT